MPDAALGSPPEWMPELPEPFEHGAGGLTWRIYQWGGFSSPPLVLLHGFGADGRIWAPLAEALAADWRVLAVDLPGHGGTRLPVSSPWDLKAVGRALALLLNELEHRDTLVLGYSLGGRIALHAALEHSLQQRLRGLILVGVSAGIAASQARADRLAADAQWIARLGEDIAKFWNDWDDQPVFATRRRLPSYTRAFPDFVRLGQDPGQLAAAMAAFGLGRMQPLHGRLRQLRAPLSLVVGAHDEKFLGLAQEFLSVIPEATLSVAAGAGHDVPTEAPHVLLPIINGFLSSDRVPSGTTVYPPPQ